MDGSDKLFQAIIVGGGPVGLTLAHTLDQAGIDYLILEARDTVLAEEGADNVLSFLAALASLVLTPNTLRVYAQLGILEDALKAGAPIGTTHVTTWAGKPTRNSAILSARSQESHGVRAHAYHRLHVMQVLYETLAPASKQKILTGKKVVDIQTTRDGVQVHCLDNTTYEGSIVIGADGVHSKTRGFMRSMALAAGADPATVNPEKPLIASYRCMWGTFPTPAGSLPGDADNCHGPKQSASIIHGKDWSWFFMYECLDEPTQARRDYTAADMEAFAGRLGEMHVSPTLQFKTVWAARFPGCAGMSNLPEGAVAHWSWGRVVLAGDAGWKVTPNMGMGYNSGVQCAVALTNALHELVHGRGVARPSTRELEGRSSPTRRAGRTALRT
ncbi:hypothetical protein PG999_010269 [Apiospora kogelbergensis]|uniref:FAD-binding domain-containing protein n=1 Tax=Apiospora kogelbergensis TaxID=1337665 RepID=A0AAW0Q9L1_9PEZI